MEKGKLFMILVSLFLILALMASYVIACSPPAPSPSQSTSPTQPSATTAKPSASVAPSPSPAAPGVIELKYAHHNQPTGTVATQMIQPWIERVQEATKGKVKITQYPAQALGKMTESFDITAKGIADICWNVSAVNPGRFPLIEAMMLPGLGIPTGRAGSEILWQLYQKFTPEIDNQFAGTKILYFSVHPPAPIYTTKKKVTNMAELQGLKLRTLGGPPTTFLKNAGASPVVMGLPDVYMGLQSGVLDGCTIDWVGYDDYKLNEVTKYIAEANFYCGTFYVVMNADTWKKLPPDIQQGILSVSGMVGSQYEGDVWDKVATADRKIAQEKGAEITTFTKDELSKWYAFGKPIWEDYAKQLDAKGLPGNQVLNEVIRLVDTYKK